MHSRFFHVDFTPESLRSLELYLPRDPRSWREEILPYLVKQGYIDEARIWLVHMWTGSYFGEVMVRNLHGRWQFPNAIIALIALMLRRPGMMYRHWYVIVEGQKIPVFELARRRETMGQRESLYEAYRLIAEGAFRDHNGHERP